MGLTICLQQCIPSLSLSLQIQPGLGSQTITNRAPPVTYEEALASIIQATEVNEQCLKSLTSLRVGGPSAEALEILMKKSHEAASEFITYLPEKPYLSNAEADKLRSILQHLSSVKSLMERSRSSTTTASELPGKGRWIHDIFTLFRWPSASCAVCFIPF